MITPTKQQKEAIDKIRSHDFREPFFLGGAAGCGKQLCGESEIQTPKGPVKIKDISVGDYVYTQDGTVTKVTGFFPQGVKPAYEITFRDKTKIIAGPEHQWVLYTSKGNLKVWTTEEIFMAGWKRPEKREGRFCYLRQVPLCEPVKNLQKDFFIHPYLLGALLGDGSLVNSTVMLSYGACDYFIPNKCEAFVKTVGQQYGSDRFTSENGKQISIVSDTHLTKKHTIMKEAVRLGINVYSHEKFIPKKYFLGSISQRLDLLQGLMDTDGTCIKNRSSYSTTSLQMAKDIKYLVSSLGGTAIIRECDRTLQDKRVEYSVNIKMFVNPFSLPRKAEKWSFSKKNPPSRYIFDIKEVPSCEQFCISVEHPSELYLTNDFVVTHNTSILPMIQDVYRNEVSFLCPTGKGSSVLKSKLPKDSIVATVHQAIYQPVEVTKEELEKLRKNAAKDPLVARRLAFLEHLLKGIGVEFLECLKEDFLKEVVVVDESSMLGRREFDILVNSGAKLIFVGDPFQLQPVSSSQCMPTDPRNFHAFLDEVHRTALENPITRLATEIRSGSFRGWEAWSKEGIGFSLGCNLDEYIACDQVLTGMNDTRMRLNAYIRGNKYSHLPVVGDKIIIKQNDYKTEFLGKGKKRKFLRLINGDITYVEKVNGLVCSFETQTGVHRDLLNDKNFCETYKETPRLEEKVGIRADYGYAITVHASQGSEWDNVIIFDDEMRVGDKQGRLHWFYTAVTRAKKNLKIVKKRR